MSSENIELDADRVEQLAEHGTVAWEPDLNGLKLSPAYEKRVRTFIHSWIPGGDVVAARIVWDESGDPLLVTIVDTDGRRALIAAALPEGTQVPVG